MSEYYRSRSLTLLVHNMGDERLEDDLVVPDDERVSPNRKTVPCRLACPHDEDVLTVRCMPRHIEFVPARINSVNRSVNNSRISESPRAVLPGLMITESSE